MPPGIQFTRLCTYMYLQEVGRKAQDTGKEPTEMN